MKISALQSVVYDERTGIIEPTGYIYRNSSSFRELKEHIDERGVTIIEPLLGWYPFTHLVRYGDMGDFDGWGYMFAVIEGE